MGTHSGFSERVGPQLFGPGSACRSGYLASRRFELAVMSILPEESERSMSVHPACRFARIRILEPAARRLPGALPRQAPLFMVYGQ
jgi:hypothetical protein